ncbi:hypothetical protein [Spirosoma agri]|uniref:MFS transporter n=1 Tax=Spirosoma agri TaxID=1987381 RepID=A0A6M0IGP9_9BACT|nr:hypothetical protein [Spirosoma agri]NEU66213.1 hypothetical protein [Spirosoma agri]
MKRKPFFMDEPVWVWIIMWAGSLAILHNMGFMLFQDYDQSGSFEKSSSAFGMLTFAFYLSRGWFLGYCK